MTTPWNIILTDKARDDYARLDGSVKRRVANALYRVSQNPLPDTEGGYGKPLGNHSDTELAGLLKIKLKADGIRIVYRLERAEDVMRVIVIGVREDGGVYHEAARRRRLHDI